MEELIQRIVAATGIDAGVARNAVGLIIRFMKQHAPAGPVGDLIRAIPGAEEAMQETAASGGGGGLLGSLGGALSGMLGGSAGSAAGTTSWLRPAAKATVLHLAEHRAMYPGKAMIANGDLGDLRLVKGR